MALGGGSWSLAGGTVQFDNTVSGAADNSGVTVAGAAKLNGASATGVNTGTGNQDYQGTLALVGGSKTLTGGTVQFDNTVSGAADNSGLTVAGAAKLNGASATGVNTGTGNQDYQGTLALVGGSKTLTGGTVQFDNTVSGAADNSGLTVAGAAKLNGQSATGVNTGTGNQDYQGTLALFCCKRSGTRRDLHSYPTRRSSDHNSGLTVAGAAKLNGASASGVNTGTGNQDYQGTLALVGGSKTLTGGTVQFDNTVRDGTGNVGGKSEDLGGRRSIKEKRVKTGTGTQDYPGTLALVGGSKALTGGTVQFYNTVSGAADNSGLTVAGAAKLNGASATGVNTGTGNQDYQGTLALVGGSKTLTGGTMQFDNTV